MALLLETVWGDLVIELDVTGSPELSSNILKLAKARYYTANLIHSVTLNRFCATGDGTGTVQGGACIFGLLDETVTDVTQSSKRFLASKGRVLTAEECQEKGRVVAVELDGMADTIGSQFWITISEGNNRALDGYSETSNQDQHFLSLGKVVEDENGILDKIASTYCDQGGRPFADIRILRALVVHDPFDDPPGFNDLLRKRGVVHDEGGGVTDSPAPEKPPEERVPARIPIDQVDLEETEQDIEKLRVREEQALRKEDQGRAVVLEMLGDLPSAEIQAPDTVLFLCKLNSITQDEDLELIFSRFDPTVKVEIIRDTESGDSLQYAFAEFTTKEQAAEAYFKMNNALVDDRRIKVDFSQSVSKIWDKYKQKLRMPAMSAVNFSWGGANAQNHGGMGRGAPGNAVRGRGGRGGRDGGHGYSGHQLQGGRGPSKTGGRPPSHGRPQHANGGRHDGPSGDRNYGPPIDRQRYDRDEDRPSYRNDHAHYDDRGRDDTRRSDHHRDDRRRNDRRDRERPREDEKDLDQSREHIRDARNYQDEFGRERARSKARSRDDRIGRDRHASDSDPRDEKQHRERSPKNRRDHERRVCEDDRNGDDRRSERQRKHHKKSSRDDDKERDRSHRKHRDKGGDASCSDDEVYRRKGKKKKEDVDNTEDGEEKSSQHRKRDRREKDSSRERGDDERRHRKRRRRSRSRS